MGERYNLTGLAELVGCGERDVCCAALSSAEHCEIHHFKCTFLVCDTKFLV